MTYKCLFLVADTNTTVCLEVFSHILSYLQQMFSNLQLFYSFRNQ